jgi:hypothetical protein
MARRLATLFLATALASSPALAYRSGPTNTDRPRDTVESRGLAGRVLYDIDKDQKFSDDMLRLAFKHMMGLLFFDTNTPPLDNCRKEMLNYYLPAFVQQQISMQIMRSEIERQMAEVYTIKEMEWMKQFYATPFGRNMLNKQFEMNARITRVLAQRYNTIRPQFAQSFETAAARCQSGAPDMPSTPSPSDELLGTEEPGAESVTP